MKSKNTELARTVARLEMRVRRLEQLLTAVSVKLAPPGTALKPVALKRSPKTKEEFDG